MIQPIHWRGKTQLKVGIVANEFFDARLGRMGGFGFLARELARLFNEEPEYGVEPVFLSGEHLAATQSAREEVTHCTRLILRQSPWWRGTLALRRERLDLLITIDYRPNYRHILWSMPTIPLVVWVNDPRPPEDVEKVNSLVIPGSDGVHPQGISPIPCTSFKGVFSGSRSIGRRIQLAAPAPSLLQKAHGTYGFVVPELAFLPYPIVLDPGVVRKSARPTAVFLGRLDPIKRPWLFLEIARCLPDVEFIYLGQSHSAGPGAWVPHSLPDNVRMLGHIEGREKLDIVSSAWVLVNTSIHEALPVSFVEALKCETPIVSCQDPECLVSRYGAYVGRWDGSGMEGLPYFVRGMRMLIEDTKWRARVGQEGREWVTKHHSRQRFLEAFLALCVKNGLTDA